MTKTIPRLLALAAALASAAWAADMPARPIETSLSVPTVRVGDFVKFAAGNSMPVIRLGAVISVGKAPAVAARESAGIPPLLSAGQLGAQEVGDIPLIERRPAVGGLKVLAGLRSGGSGAPVDAGGLEGLSAFDEFWDNEPRRDYADEMNHREEVRRIAEEKKAAMHAHAPPPKLDYRFHQFNKETAEHYVMGHHYAHGDLSWTGRELIDLLMTPQALDVRAGIDPDHLPMSRFGKTDADIRQVLEEKKIPRIVFEQALRDAGNYGIVYTAYAFVHNKTYYGVPSQVRDVLGMTAPETTPAFALSFTALAGDMESAPESDELFEFAAQLARSAEKEGLLRFADLPEGFRKRAEALRFETPPLAGALMTLLEASNKTDWSAKAEEVCRHAVDAGLLDNEEFQQALLDLKHAR